MNYTFKILIAIISVSLSACSSTETSPAPTSDLAPYLSCSFADNLQIDEINERNCSRKIRAVYINGQFNPVSVIEGYRLMFKYPERPYYFANVKVEKSDPVLFSTDKEVVIRELEYLHPDVTVSEINGYKHYGIDNTNIDSSGGIGKHILFSETDNVIMSFYFLTQGKEKRVFNNFSEYEATRDNFLSTYTKCINSNKTNK